MVSDGGSSNNDTRHREGEEEYHRGRDKGIASDEGLARGLQ